MIKALVAGGSGYFGSLLVRELLSRGHTVGVLDVADAHDRPASVTFHRADVRDERAVQESVEGYTHVFHNVAQVPLAKDSNLFHTVNVDGTRNLLRACQKSGVRKVVYTSSSAVYGAPEVNPVTEETPPNPGEAYGAAKLDAEKLCGEFRELGMDVTIIRPRTILGHGRLGIFQILFEWIRLGKNIPVLGGGQNVYQFVHADDLAAACILAGERSGGASYNIGSSRFGTMREGLEELCQHAGTGSRVRSVPMAPAVWAMRLTSTLGWSPLGAYHALMYGRSMYFDIGKAQAELGYAPKFSNGEMLRQRYDWYLEHRESLAATLGQSHHRSPVAQGILSLVSRWL